MQAVPYGEQPDIACTVGKLAENIPKNRFKTTFPCKGDNSAMRNFKYNTNIFLGVHEVVKV